MNCVEYQMSMHSQALLRVYARGRSRSRCRGGEVEKTLFFLLIDLLVVFSLLFDGKGPLSGRRDASG